MDRSRTMLLRKAAIWSLCWLVLFSQASNAFANVGGANGVAQFDVRTTGSDSNAGCFDPSVTSPGTDYSQQNSPQVAFTDLVIGATNTQLTSAANPFTSAFVGNCIIITAGTGFTTGLYEVVSVSGVTATMDRTVGSAASTGGVGNLGGSLLTPQHAGALINLYATSAGSPTIWLKTGTYSTSSAITSLYVSSQMTNLIGYGSTHGDNGTRPLITTATNSINLIDSTASAKLAVNNVNFSSTAGTPGPAFHAANNGITLSISNAFLTGFGNTIDGDFSVNWNFPELFLNKVEIASSTSYAVWNNNSAVTVITNSYIHGGSTAAVYVGGSNSSSEVTIENTIIANNAGAGFLGTTNSALCQLSVTHSTFFGNSGSDIDISAGFSPPGNAVTCFLGSISNNIFYGNGSGAYGVNAATAALSWTTPAFLSFNNAYGNHATGNTHNFNDASPTTLSANPFTSSGTGDFSLNSTTGGGILLKGLGYPGTFPGGTSTGHLDIGAIQSAGGGGGSSAANSSYAN